MDTSMHQAHLFEKELEGVKHWVLYEIGSSHLLHVTDMKNNTLFWPSSEDKVQRVVIWIKSTPLMPLRLLHQPAPHRLRQTLDDNPRKTTPVRYKWPLSTQLSVTTGQTWSNLKSKLSPWKWLPQHAVLDGPTASYWLGNALSDAWTWQGTIHSA